MPALLTLEPGAVRVETTREGETASTEVVPALSADGEPELLPKGVNPEYLRSMVASVKGTVVIRAEAPKVIVRPDGSVDESRPPVFQVRAADPADTFRALVMPIRIAA